MGERVKAAAGRRDLARKLEVGRREKMRPTSKLTFVALAWLDLDSIIQPIKQTR